MCRPEVKNFAMRLNIPSGLKNSKSFKFAQHLPENGDFFRKTENITQVFHFNKKEGSLYKHNRGTVYLQGKYQWSVTECQTHSSTK
jgi:type II secretory pathway component PulJ